MALIVILKPSLPSGDIMSIIVLKPTLPDSPTPEQTDQYNLALTDYNEIINEIRQSVWDSLDDKILPAGSIDNRSRLRAAERIILQRAGSADLTRAQFEALSQAEQDKLILAAIYQTALLILPAVPQLKRSEAGDFQNEFFQTVDREKFLEDQLDKLYPETVSDDEAMPSGGAIVSFNRVSLR